MNTTENLSSTEQDLRSCRDALERASADKDMLQRQLSSQLLDIERLKQEKESLLVQNRVLERELHEAREKLSHCSKNLNVVTDNVNQNETLIIQLKEDLKHRDEKYLRLQAEFRNTMESIAILLSLPTRFAIDALRDKLGLESQQLSRTAHVNEQVTTRLRILEDERNMLEAKLHKLESDLNSLELARDSLRKDKSNMLYYGYYGTLPRLRRERSFHDLPYLKETAVVYQLQRRIKILREQLQRKDLHLDLLRRKLSVQEESCRVRAVLQAERDEALSRSKKLARQCDKLSVQL
ncbi:Coiled-coil domain-containing protein C6orf97, partial [Operophtera brumata]